VSLDEASVTAEELQDAMEAEEEGEEEEDMDVGDDNENIQETSAKFGVYSADEVNIEVFEELQLPLELAQEVQDAWKYLLKTLVTHEAAGEAIYSALFEASPAIQPLFKTPRAVMALRFMTGINQIVQSLDKSSELKTVVETLGFQHLDLDVTVPRVHIFRDAILELVVTEIGDRVSPVCKDGFAVMLNYVGGAYIYVRSKFSVQLKILHSSWATASKGAAGIQNAEETGGSKSETLQPAGSTKGAKEGKDSRDPKKTSASYQSEGRNTAVPKNFEEMFQFNAAVMGLGKNGWMNEILSSFDAIVMNVANTFRLQEECDVVSLRMAKYSKIVLSEYKAVMLASLRSLCKDWGSEHELAWSWLWENVERLLKNLMGKPALQEAALSGLLASLDDSALSLIRREVYSQFFALAPAGQEYFKQSTTRLHFIADKVVSMTLEMYREPKRMIEDLSALGLRHVGYAIPTELFGPFVTACVQVVHSLGPAQDAEEAFRWSLNLLTRVLTRVINEGSTVVMKAINANSDRMLRKAVACAPRGQRALWSLNVQVGTQSISPLLWALESGSLEAAKAILNDLLTIRADRDRYYFGADMLFERHPDIIKRLATDGPSLLPTLLDGLIWRSRITQGGRRRVVFYIKNFIINTDGSFARNLEWLFDCNNPSLVCHALVSTCTDVVWSRVAFRDFTTSRLWFLFTVVLFVLSQSILNHLHNGAIGQNPEGLRITIFFVRCFLYLFSMGTLWFRNIVGIISDYRSGAVVKRGPLKFPEYLMLWDGAARMVLAVLLTLMLSLEPVIHCLGDPTALMFAERCSAVESLYKWYSWTSCTASFVYFLLLTDLAVFSTRFSAYTLVCSRAIVDLFLWACGGLFVTFAFACCVCSLEQDNAEFHGIPKSTFSLMKVTFKMFSGESLSNLEEHSVLLGVVGMYSVVSVIFLLSVLVAQLSCAYKVAHQDMMGLARLHRIRVICDTMATCKAARWARFVDSLHLDERVEFGEGDIGLPGGIPIWEPASLHITTVDMIKRYGGSTNEEEQWPEEPIADNEDDRFDRVEKLIQKSMKRIAKGGGSAGGSKMTSSVGSMSMGSSMGASGA